MRSRACCTGTSWKLRAATSPAIRSRTISLVLCFQGTSLFRMSGRTSASWTHYGHMPLRRSCWQGAGRCMACWALTRRHVRWRRRSCSPAAAMQAAWQTPLHKLEATCSCCNLVWSSSSHLTTAHTMASTRQLCCASPQKASNLQSSSCTSCSRGITTRSVAQRLTSASTWRDWAQRASCPSRWCSKTHRQAEAVPGLPWHRCARCATSSSCRSCRLARAACGWSRWSAADARAARCCGAARCGAWSVSARPGMRSPFCTTMTPRSQAHVYGLTAPSTLRMAPR
mmetsp:Transcript_12705/g.37088  ORF Transcript_12705/g.37088 Transcript_12705/m.37088 type:complete len:284 (-) Transcript_12705:909-1760(-)